MAVLHRGQQCRRRTEHGHLSDLGPTLPARHEHALKVNKGSEKLARWNLIFLLARVEQGLLNVLRAKDLAEYGA